MLLFALCGTALSVWIGLSWTPSWIAAALFALSAVALGATVMRPRIEIYETHLAVASRVIRWSEIRRVDQTAWRAPLIVNLTLADGERVRIVYPGVLESTRALLADLQRRSRQARIDDVPYRDFWAEAEPAVPPTITVASAKNAGQGPSRYPMLSPEDERDVERMFQKLKSAGRIEQPESGEPIESAGAED